MKGQRKNKDIRYDVMRRMFAIYQEKGIARMTAYAEIAHIFGLSVERVRKVITSGHERGTRGVARDQLRSTTS